MTNQERALLNHMIYHIGGYMNQVARFELNDQITRNSTKDQVERYLQGLVTKRQIYEFKVICDSSNNTPAVVTRHEFQLDVSLKFNKSPSYIAVSLIIPWDDPFHGMGLWETLRVRDTRPGPDPLEIVRV